MLERQVSREERIERVRTIANGPIVVVAGLYSLMQLTPFAPFPHRADSFVAGLAAGAALGYAILWAADRRSRSPRVS
jgi:hypothetical protein